MAGRPRTIIAFCYASGHIEFGSKVPSGGLPICKGTPSAVKELIQGTARHGWGEDNPLLVPGVPEAENQSAALDALRAYTGWIAKTPTPGVEFLHSAHASAKTATARTQRRQRKAIEAATPAATTLPLGEEKPGG